MAFRIKSIRSYKCNYDNCYYSFTSTESQSAIDKLLEHFKTHFQEPADDEADCG